MAKKSKAETAFTQCADERDHWRRLAEERGQRIADLERELDMARIDGGALTSGAQGSVQYYRNAVDQLLRERNELVSLITNLDDAYSEAVNTWVARLDQAEQRFALDSGDRAYMPVLARVLWYITEGVENDINETYDKPLPGLPSAALVRLRNLMKNSRLASLYDLELMLKVAGWEQSKSPEMLAADLLDQMDQGREIDPVLVYQLYANWPKPPCRPGTMIEALETVREVVKYAGKTRQYGMPRKASINVEERQLRNYRRYVDALRELASSSPHLLSE